MIDMKNKSQFIKYLITISGVLLAFLILCSSIRKMTDSAYIWLEAEAAEKMIEPLTIIEMSEASGGKAIVSHAQSHKVESYASYGMDVLQEGSYQFWGRCYWPGACSNNFLIKVDESPKILFGDDPLLEQWHWVKGPLFFLKKGKSTLFIWNEEFDSRLDKMLLTTDTYFVPSTSNEARDYDIDFESGDTRNISPNSSNKWSVKNEHEMTHLSGLLHVRDLLYPASLVTRLQEDTKIPLCKFLRMNFSNATRRLINKYDGSTEPSSEFQRRLVDEINRILREEYIYDTERFKYVALPGKVKKIINKHRGNNFIHLNRMLLEETMPGEISRLPGNNVACYLSRLEKGTQEWARLKFACSNEFVFQIDIKCGEWQASKRDVRIPFHFHNKQNNYCLIISGNTASLIIIQDSQERELARVHVDNLLNNRNYNHFSIIRNDPAIIIKYNDKKILTALDSTFSGGYLDIGSQTGDLYFDNIRFLTTLTPDYRTNFWSCPLDHEHWQIEQGFWEWKTNGLMSLHGKQMDDQDALIVFQKNYWKNYSFTTAFKMNGDKGRGICFYYQDKKNYYLCRWIESTINRKNIKKIQLVKVENGIDAILAEKPANYINENWYKLEVRVCNNEIRAYIDDNQVLCVSDSFFSEGGIGLWTNSTQSEIFDCVTVKPFTTFDIIDSTRYHYNFNIRERAALDLCDWIFSDGNTMEQPYGVVWGGPMLHKKLLKPAVMKNKRVFPASSEIHCQFRYAIPDGITVCVIFNCLGVHPNTEYIFKLNNQFALLLKNDEIIKEVKTGISSIEDIKVTHNKNLWKLDINNNCYMEIDDETNFTRMKIALSFTGIDETLLRFSKISIEELENKGQEIKDALAWE